MGDNKAAAKELAERQMAAVAEWQAAMIAEREAEAALIDARMKLRSAISKMSSAQQAFEKAMGGAPVPTIDPGEIMRRAQAQADHGSEEWHRNALY